MTRAAPEELRRSVSNWNSRYPVGTKVRTRLHPDDIYATSSAATILFGRRAVVHLEGFAGYFDLRDIHPLPQSAPAEAKRIALLFPGQGTQKRGMGRELFSAYPELTRRASQILGYSIERLCVEDPADQLDQTQYAQLAVYVVNALGYLQARRTAPPADAFMGHSLGEYNALLAAGVFDFESGLRLVMKRAELTGAVTGGAMAAVLGTSAQVIRAFLCREQLDLVDLANYNTPTQTVISGPTQAMERAISALTAEKMTVVRLRVSAAFHSRQMHDAQRTFAEYLRAFNFAAPVKPVIANATGLPYHPERIAATLSAQITSPVRWLDGVSYLLGQGNFEFVEIGGALLTPMVREIASTRLGTRVPVTDSP